MEIKRLSLQITLDLVIFIASFLFATQVNREFEMLLNLTDLIIICLTAVIALFILVIFRFYLIFVKFIIGSAALPVALASIFSSLVAFLLSLFMDASIEVVEILLYLLLSFIGILGVRFLYRDLIFRQPKIKQKRVLIYGAGEAGRQFLNSLSAAVEYTPIAFVDDDKTLHGHYIGGLRILGRTKLLNLVSKYGIDLIVLAIPSLSNSRRKEILLEIQKAGAEVKVIPGLSELISNSIDKEDARAISISDILGRPSVPPDEKLMSQAIDGKVVMVTGAGGSIGSEICRQVLCRNPRTLILFDISEASIYLIYSELKNLCTLKNLDIRLEPILGSVSDSEKIKFVFECFGVTDLFHAAAYKHVPLVEMNIVEGVRNNIFGTKTLVEKAIEVGVEKVTLISTDKAVRPTNIMGATKRMAEFVGAEAAKNAKTIVSMVRFGNVLGSSGSVIPLFEQQIKKGGPVTVTHPDVTRFFMTISEAAQLVIQASSMAKGGEIYLLDMGEPVKIVDMAISMVKLSGKIPLVVEEDEDIKDHNVVSIIFSGLRPGEKLYEELLVGTDSERTAHPLISSVKEPGSFQTTLNDHLDLLKTACDENDGYQIRNILIRAGTGLEHSGKMNDILENSKDL